MRLPLHSRLLCPALLILPLTALLVPHAAAQQSGTTPRARVIPTVGYLVFGSYFSGPGDLEFSNENGPAYGGELEVTLGHRFSVIGSGPPSTSGLGFSGVS